MDHRRQVFMGLRLSLPVCQWSSWRRRLSGAIAGEPAEPGPREQLQTSHLCAESPRSTSSRSVSPGLLDQLDVARLPAFVDRRLARAVEAQDREVALARYSPNQLLSLPAVLCFVSGASGSEKAYSYFSLNMSSSLLTGRGWRADTSTSPQMSGLRSAMTVAAQLSFASSL